jgi:acyl-CoA reductase-like NAD-dependent aldehyde dehydrogenase
LALRGYNWIDGEARAAVGESWYELADADGLADLGRWPRSNGADLDAALDAARAAERGWRDPGAGAREDRLRACAAAFLDAPDPDGIGARALGFDAEEARAHLDGLSDAVGGALAGAPDLARGTLGAREGPCLLAPSWTETWHAPSRAVFFALRAGRPVILAPDGRLPVVGDALRRALAELPPGVFQIVHDDGRTLVRAALEASPQRLQSLVAAQDRCGPLAEPAAHVDVVPPRRASSVVDPSRDLRQEARRILDGAIGRVRALSGSRPGQIGRVVVPERAFSHFGELLLADLETSPDAANPLGSARRAQRPALENAFALGLDEGATAVFTGPGREHRLFPVVFTNVERGMRIARFSTPCALLVLLRAPDLRAAHAAAARLDREELS